MSAMSRSNGAEPPYASIDDRESQAPEPYIEQAGLEVAAHQQSHATDLSGLEVTQAPHEHYQDSGKEAVAWGKSEKIPVVEDCAEVEGVGKTPPPTTPKRKRRFLIGGAIFLLVVLGAVVGGLMAARASRKENWRSSTTGDSGNAEPTGTSVPTSTTNSTKTSLSIKQGSPLTVTGWREGMGTEIYLFYLNTDNVLQRSTSTSISTLGSTNESWGTIDKISSFVSGSSRMSGTIIQYGYGYRPQIEVFYTNEDKRLSGLNFNNNYTPRYQNDSIKDMLLVTGANSSVSAYWPWATFQGPDGALWEVRNRLRENFSPAAEWDAKRLGIIAADASRLALVPLTTNFSKIAIKGGYGIIYRDEDGRLAAVMPDIKFNSDELASDYAASWPTNFLSITLPEQGVFAAFSVARPSDSLGRVNTYILYLDASSNINVAYTEDSSSWLISRPSALQNVDHDTDIACLTMATTYRDSRQSEVPLIDDYTLARCYFQKGGMLRDMAFDGTDWLDVGNVPVS